MANPKFRGKKKWSERVADVFAASGKHWDDNIKNEVKNIVSAQVSANPSNALTVVDQTVFDGLVSALETRLKEKEKAQQDAAGNA